MRPRRSLDDRMWRGYDPRAVVPAVAVAVVASAMLLAGRWVLRDLSALVDRVGALAVYAAVLAVWLGTVGVLLRRVVTRTYRLTDRALLVDWGFLSKPERPVWLADVAGVTSGATWVGRVLGAGWVQINSTDGRTIRLTGVRDPGAFAIAVRAAVEQNRSDRPG